MPKPSPAMVVAVVALVSSLTGGAVAATVITGKNVKNSSLTGADLKDRSITGKDLKKGSVGADRLTAAARAALKGATGPSGPPGVTGTAGPIGPQGPAGTPGIGVVTHTVPAGSLQWGVFDVNGTNENGVSQNGGFAYTPLTGGPRQVFVRVVLPATIPGGTAGTIAALHLCYRARTTVRVDTVSLERYRGDVVDATGLQTAVTLLTDTTERQDAACRRYPVTGDAAVRAGDTFVAGVELEVDADGNSNANRLRILSLGIEMAAG